MAYILMEWTGETKNYPSTAEQSNDQSRLSHILDTVCCTWLQPLLASWLSINRWMYTAEKHRHVMFITVLNTLDHLTSITSGALLGVEAAVKYK